MYEQISFCKEMGPKMNVDKNSANLKDRGLLIKILGWIFFLAGIGIAFLAPLEIYCFYLFSYGGRYYYEGFGFGSFMFANIAGQVIGYYLIALILLTLGYGHLKIRKWGRNLSISLLYLVDCRYSANYSRVFVLVQKKYQLP